MKTVVWFSLAILLAACTDTVVDAVPARGTGHASMLAGNRSMGPHADTVLATMRQPLVVIVVDDEGVPMPGFAVHWEAFDGASVSDRTMLTDAGGESIVSLILGPRTGTYRARAHAPGIPGSPIDFVASAGPGNPVSIEKVRADEQEVTAGGRVGHMVRALDGHGNGAHGVLIEWIAEDGGALSWSRGFTWKPGFAEVIYTTGVVPTSQRVTARAPELPFAPTVTFTTRVIPRHEP